MNSTRTRSANSTPTRTRTANTTRTVTRSSNSTRTNTASRTITASRTRIGTPTGTPSRGRPTQTATVGPVSATRSSAVSLSPTGTLTYTPTGAFSTTGTFTGSLTPLPTNSYTGSYSPIISSLSQTFTPYPYSLLAPSQSALQSDTPLATIAIGAVMGSMVLIVVAVLSVLRLNRPQKRLHYTPTMMTVATPLQTLPSNNPLRL